MLDNVARIMPSITALDHQRLTSLVNSMADGVVATDETATIVMYNGAALNLLDRNTSMEGLSVDKVMALIDKNNQPVDIRQLVLSTTKAMTTRDYLLRYNDNSKINLYLSIAPVHLGYGRRGQRGYVLMLRDITHEKSLEEERDEFISVVSHELRTPIAIAEGNISNAQMIIAKDGSRAQVDDALRQAHDQVMFLSNMINDLATLSRAERGKLAVEVTTVNAHQLVEDLAKDYTPEAQKKGLVFNMELDPRLEMLQSSKLYVREILQNFLTNAIKYTETGQVTLGARPEQNGVLFWVQDSGIGISHGDQERIFDKFFRSEDYRTRQHKGTGLGLYVTMKLASLIHAEIDVQSELNKGSTFRIFIPNL